MSNLRAVTIRMRQVLKALEADYDFSAFTMKGFRAWLEQCTGRPIRFVPRDLRSASGGWVANVGGCDLVFYDENAPEIHQAHIQLHELSHIICNHPRVELGVLLDGTDVHEAVLLRGAHSEKVELEAELLASLIQERVIHYGRLAELTEAASTSFAEHFSSYIAQLGE